jgi:hypothetical protein
MRMSPTKAVEAGDLARSLPLSKSAKIKSQWGIYRLRKGINIVKKRGHRQFFRTEHTRVTTGSRSLMISEAATKSRRNNQLLKFVISS